MEWHFLSHLHRKKRPSCTKRDRANHFLSLITSRFFHQWQIDLHYFRIYNISKNGFLLFMIIFVFYFTSDYIFVGIERTCLIPSCASNIQTILNSKALICLLKFHSKPDQFINNLKTQKHYNSNESTAEVDPATLTKCRSGPRLAWGATARESENLPRSCADASRKAFQLFQWDYKQVV